VNPNPVQVGGRPYVIALTGGIATGKTLVSDEFARLGIAVIDMDAIAREIVEPGQPALQAIKSIFGPEIIAADGGIKRSKLRSLIFSDSVLREKLESILHPLIRQKAREAIATVTSVYCILVIPLLADRGKYPDVNRVLVVDVDTNTQIHRLMARDNYSQSQAEQALAAQPTRELRLEIADDILDNSGPPAQTRKKVSGLNREYLRLAKDR
jgi:dephospho-CoA kinase